MSKSVGNVIDPVRLAEHYGVDQLRYFFLREVPFGQDGNYSHEAIVQRINADLANDLGNLAQRSLSMIARNCAGRVPTPSAFSDADETMLAQGYAIGGRARAAMGDFALHQVLAEIWQVVAQANRYFAGEEPWVKRKSDPARMATVLYVTAEVLRVLAIFIQPFMPAKMGTLLDQLAVSPGDRGFDKAVGAHRLVAGIALPPPSPVFPRYIEPEQAPG